MDEQMGRDGSVNMRKWMAALVLGIAVIALVFGIGNQQREEEVFVMAAASLQDVLGEVAASYEEETGVSVVLDFASSGTLRKGIEEGADPDIYLSASTNQMDLLSEKGLVDEAYRRTLVMNQVVLITALEDPVNSLNDVADTGAMLAMGDPDFVPAGQYAMKIIQMRGLEEALKGQFLICKDVRQVLAYVDRQEVDYGLVYRTDAMVGSQVSIIEEYGARESGLVEYPAALLSHGQANGAAQDFFSFLFEKEAREIYEAHGFLLAEE